MPETPVAIDNPLFPTQVAFPITISSPNRISANGAYTFYVNGGIRTPAGQYLSSGAIVDFNLADTVAPRVINTTVNGRIITIQFSEAIRASTIIPSNIILVRAGSDGSFGKPSNVFPTNDPRVRITYDAATNTATLDFSALDQSQLPSDQYALVILAGDNGGPGVTDLAGNFLDGEFNGVFPSGNGNPTGPSGNERFTQFFGFRALTAPVVTSFQLTDASDTGIKGDGNTNLTWARVHRPGGRQLPRHGLRADRSWSSSTACTAVFSTWCPVRGGRGFVGNFDVVVTTDANGTFRVQAPFLPEGYNSVRIVVVGQPDAPLLPGLSSAYTSAFRIDRRAPR